jgi:selenium metabolism protein YedF
MRTVDTKGQKCPVPIIETKKALRASQKGESFLVLTDNKTAFSNISRFLNDNKIKFSVLEKSGEWIFNITNETGENITTAAEDYCSEPIAHLEKGNYIIVLTSDKMGEGDEELGHLLISNFIKALKDLDRLPQKMVFYNKGVTLVTKNSPVIEHLKDLEKMGVELLLCATCVNHYSLEASIGAGTLSNMYTIAATMASAGHIIRP